MRSRWNVRLPLMLALAAQVACGPAAPPTPEGFAGHSFDVGECGELIEGSATASADARAATGVARYRYALSRDGQIALTLEGDDGEDLGEVRVGFALSLAPSLEWTTEITYAQAGDVRARVTHRGRKLGAGTQHEVRQEAGGVEGVLWFTLDDALTLRRLVAGAPVPGNPPAAEGQLRVGGVSYDVLELFQDGVTAPAETQAAFVAATGGAALDGDEAHLRLRVSLGDAAWQERLASQLRACQASGADYAEANAERRGLDGAAQALTCAKTPSPLDAVVTTHSILDATTGFNLGPRALGGGSASAFGLTGAIVAAGLVTTGPAIAATFVASVIVTVAIGKAVDWAVANSKEELATGASTAVNAIVFGDASPNEAFVEFYAGKPGSTGDPHLTTLDGRSYDLQVAGELVLLESTAGPRLVVQVRQEPVAGICSSVAINTAVAMQLGSDRVGIYTDERADRLWVNGEPSGTPGDVLALPGGGFVIASGRGWILADAAGSSVWVGGGHYLDVRVAAAPERAGELRGLLGNLDGNADNDLRMKDGTPLVLPPVFDVVVGPYADSWRVAAGASLFDYEPGEDASTFLVPGFPSGAVGLDELPADARAAGEATCTAAGVADAASFADCVLDVGCTGDSQYAQSHVGRANDRGAFQLVDAQPIEGFVPSGPEPASDWSVSADSMSAEKTTGPDASFFVGPDDHLGVRVNATVTVPEGSGWSAVGLVFGYQGPLDDGAGGQTEANTFLLSWLGRNYGAAEPGLRLVHLHGPLDAYHDEALLYFTDPDVATPLGQDTGIDKGWQHDAVTTISVLYTADELRVSVNNEERFVVAAADSPAPFTPGRVGFFTYRQPEAIFSDLQIGPPTPVAPRLPCRFVMVDDIQANVTLGEQCPRYLVKGHRRVYAGLTIAPSTVVEFASAASLSVEPTGILNAVSPGAEPIRMVGVVREPGTWGGVSFLSQLQGNALKNVEIRHTGSAGYQYTTDALTVAGITTSPGRVVLEDLLVADTGGGGITVRGGGEVPGFARARFERVAGVPLRVPCDELGNVDAESRFAGVGVSSPWVEVWQSNTFIDSSATWRALDVPWRFIDTCRIEGAGTLVTVEAGARLEFDGSGVDVRTGSLLAEGTAAAPISFTAASGAPGGWSGLWYQSDLTTNRLDHVDIGFAGADGFQYENTSIMVSGTGTTPGRVELRNSSVHDSSGSAVLVHSGGTFVEEGNSYANNAGGDVVAD